MPPGVQTRQVAAWGHSLAGRTSVSLAEPAGPPVVGSSPRVAGGAAPGGGPPSGRHAGHVPVSASCRELFPRPGIRCVDVPDASVCTAVLAWSSARRDTPEVAALRRVVGGMVGMGGTHPNPRWWHTEHTESEGD